MSSSYDRGALAASAAPALRPATTRESFLIASLTAGWVVLAVLARERLRR